MEPTLEQIFGSYTAWEAKEGTWFINFMNGSENMYLLEGDEKALLILSRIHIFIRIMRRATESLKRFI